MTLESDTLRDGDQAQKEIRIDADGTIHMPPIVVPLSEGLSHEARMEYILYLNSRQPIVPREEESLEGLRGRFKLIAAALNEEATSAYSATATEATICGLRVHEIRPLDDRDAVKAKRVIIHLHGGAFNFGQDLISDAIAVCGVSGIRVISVDYSLAPDHKYPKQVDEVIAVYQELLHEYGPSGIGFLGTSAGASLVRMVTARLIRDQRTLPAAIGFAFGGLGEFTGDSSYVAPPLSGYVLGGGLPLPILPRVVLGNENIFDPMISPLYSEELLRKFPPTIFLTSTRDEDLSRVAMSHRALTKVGVQAYLHVWEGLPHAFWIMPDKPESTDAYKTVAAFFDGHLRS